MRHISKKHHHAGKPNLKPVLKSFESHVTKPIYHDIVKPLANLPVKLADDLGTAEKGIGAIGLPVILIGGAIIVLVTLRR